MTTTSTNGHLLSLTPLRSLMFKNLQNGGVRPEKVKHYTYIISASEEDVITDIFVEAHAQGQKITYLDDLVACLKDAGSDAEAEKVMKCYVNSL